MIDFSKLINEILDRGIGQREAARKIGCTKGYVSAQKGGTIRQPAHDIGENIRKYHKKVMAMPIVILEEEDEMKWADMMEDIRRTGLNDIDASKAIGYSRSHYSAMRRGEVRPSGQIKMPNAKGREKVEALYNERKNLPNRDIKYAKKPIGLDRIRLIAGFQA